jgi:hypothetical protein
VTVIARPVLKYTGNHGTAKVFQLVDQVTGHLAAKKIIIFGQVILKNDYPVPTKAFAILRESGFRLQQKHFTLQSHL